MGGSPLPCGPHRLQRSPARDGRRWRGRHLGERGRVRSALVGEGDRHVAELVDRLRPRRRDPAWYAASVNAGTVADHVGRFRELAEAGVSEVMVRLPDLDGAGALGRMAKVISAFR